MKPGLIAPEDPLDSCGSPGRGAPSAKRTGKLPRELRRERRKELAELKRELVKGDNAVALAFFYTLVSLVWFGGGWLGWIPWFERTSWTSDPAKLGAAMAGLVVLLGVQGWCLATYRRNPWVPSLLTLLVSGALAALWVEVVGLYWLFSFGAIFPGLGTNLWELYHRESRTPPLEGETELLEAPLMNRHKSKVETALATARSGRSPELIAIAGTGVITAVAFVFRLAVS